MQLKNRILLLLLPLLGCLGFTSCESPAFFDESIPIENRVWGAEELKEFEFSIDDTLANFNFFVNLRHEGTYQFSNLFLFINTEFPNGRSLQDTVQLPLADAKGAWYGKSSGDLYSHRIMYKLRRRFPLTGLYKIRVRQGMREENLEGITDVGIRLELLNQ